MRLGHHDLIDIRLRQQLRQSTPEDVEALLLELDDLLDDVRAIAAQVNAEGVVTPREVAELLRARLEEDEETAARVREHEAFERGCSAVMTAYKTLPEVKALLEDLPLAAPGEFCSMCSRGHADEYGFCGRHGKKVRGIWTETDGPTQTGLVSLLALAIPLFEQIAHVWSSRPKPKKAHRAR